MIPRLAAFAYWVFTYLLFVAVVIYFGGFIANRYVPSTIDSGLQLPESEALLRDLELLGAFGIQHSLMARPFFKRWIPWPVERTTYMLASCIALIAIFVLWEPIPDLVWNLAGGFWLRIVAAAGLVLVVWASLTTGHWDTFGFRHARAYLRRREYAPLPFRVRGPYRWSRHPMMLGVILILWATPQMSKGHLLFSAVLTLYVIAGSWLEERDLLRRFPVEYEHYRTRVRMFV
ncbi:MAG: hypothetical protein R2729_10725 [Bryobacteraceae bacterium]